MKNLAKFGMMPGLIQCKYKLMITVPLLDHYALLLFDPWPDCNLIYKSITLIYEPIELPGKWIQFWPIRHEHDTVKDHYALISSSKVMWHDSCDP